VDPGPNGGVSSASAGTNIGKLTFNGSLFMDGGTLRLDLGTTNSLANSDLVEVDSGFYAYATHFKSAVRIDDNPNNPLPTSGGNITYHLVDYGTSTFQNPTYDLDFFGTTVHSPTNLFVSSLSSSKINGRSAQLTIDETDPSHHYLN